IRMADATVCWMPQVPTGLRCFGPSAARGCVVADLQVGGVRFGQGRSGGTSLKAGRYTRFARRVPAQRWFFR
ncbi:MAG TPA: hypothetical protein VED66_15320, partial [Candidatus Sulfotelmatobacter sp.]|nr:hypothetical protein [Candidatus Sulfotelmatobacter sp.]